LENSKIKKQLEHAREQIEKLKNKKSKKLDYQIRYEQLKAILPNVIEYLDLDFFPRLTMQDFASYWNQLVFSRNFSNMLGTSEKNKSSF
jgi:hypothetical protein